MHQILKNQWRASILQYVLSLSYEPSGAMRQVRGSCAPGEIQDYLSTSQAFQTCPSSYLCALRGHRLGYRLGQLVSQLISLIYGRGTRDPRGAPYVDPSHQLDLVWDFSALYPRSFLPDFILLFNYYYCVSFSLQFHYCYSHTRGILFGIHSSCMGFPFAIVHAEWSLVFWSFRIMLCRVEKNFKLTNKNSNNNLIRAILCSFQISYFSTDVFFLLLFQSFCSHAEGAMKYGS